MRPLAALPFPLALVCGLWLAWPTGCGDPAQQAEQAREQARAALARGEREQALAAIDALERAQPEDAGALLERAQLLVAAGETARAVWLLEEGVTAHPDAAPLRLLLAEAALLVNDPARAERALDALESAAGAPGDPERAAQVLLLRARAALARGDLERALAHFRAAEASDRGSAALRGPRIAALLAEGRVDEAARAVRDARDAAESAADRELARGFALALHQLRAADARNRLQAARAAGDAEAARADLDAALRDTGALAREAPRDLAAWQSWITGLLAAGRASDALAALDAAERDDPDWLAWTALRAHALLAAGDAAGAEAALREGMTRDPTPSARVPLARFLASRGRSEEALALLDVDAAGDDAPRVRHARAELLLDAERPDAAASAIDAFAAALGTADDPAVELLRGRLALLRGDAEEAADRLHQLLPRHDTAPAQYWLARALEASGDRDGAARRYALAAQRAPSEPGAFAALARLARERGAWREAAAASQQLVVRAPTAVSGWETWVDALLQQGEPAAAREVALASRQALPDAPEPLLLEARALRAGGRPDEARAVLTRARERFGALPEIAAEQVLADVAAGRAEPALATARAALARPDLAPAQRAALHHAEALAQFASDRFDAGARAIDAALAADADPRPLRTRCEFAAASGRLETARRDCARYLDARPDDAGIQFVHGAVLDRSGDAAGAQRAYERAAALDPGAAAPRNNLALLRHAAGDLDGALEAAQQAYALASDDAQVLDTLGALYLARGLPERAVALLERAHALAPDDAAIAQRLEGARAAKAGAGPVSP